MFLFLYFLIQQTIVIITAAIIIAEPTHAIVIIAHKGNGAEISISEFLALNVGKATIKNLSFPFGIWK